MFLAAAAAAAWKSSTTTADPSGSLAASFAIEAVTSADITPSIASSSPASAPNPGTANRGASMKPAQKRTGSASASSHDSQDVMPGSRAAAQLDKSTLLPAPADPTTTVSRWPAPAASRSCSADLVTSVVGRVAGRNFARANRGPCGPSRPVAERCATTSPRNSAHRQRGSPRPFALDNHRQHHEHRPGQTGSCYSGKRAHAGPGTSSASARSGNRHQSVRDRRSPTRPASFPAYRPGPQRGLRAPGSGRARQVLRWFAGGRSF